MSQLQIVQRTTPRNGPDHTDAAATEIEEARSDSSRKMLYEGLRQRDAWLRKAWRRASPVVEFQ